MFVSRSSRVRLAAALTVVVAVAALVARFTVAPGADVAVAEGSYRLAVPYVAVHARVPLASAGWVSPFGVTMYGELGNADAVDMLAAMSRAGTSWVATAMSWATVEGTKDAAYQWARYDTQFLNASLAGMDVYVLVQDVPTWAQSGTRPYAGGAPGMDVASLAQFVAAAAERYDGDGNSDAPSSPVVKYWALFAEPDYCGDTSTGDCKPYSTEEFKGIWGDSGDDYAAMLAVVAPAVKAANPNAVVTNGGVAFDYFTDTTYSVLANRLGKFVRSFTADVMAANGARYLDAFAIHSFSYPTTTWGTRLQSLYATADGNATARAQLEALPVISPEMGYWSSFVQPNGSVITDEAEQARTLVQMFVQGVANGVDRLAWFTVFDSGDPEDNPSEQHGLFWDHDLSRPKRSYWAYQTMATELHGYSYTGPLHDSSSDYRAYRFANAVSGQTTVVAWATGTTADVSFTAGRLAIVQMDGAASSTAGFPVTITDGGSGDLDGSVNGSVRIQVSENPVYVRIQ